MELSGLLEALAASATSVVVIGLLLWLARESIKAAMTNYLAVGLEQAKHELSRELENFRATLAKDRELYTSNVEALRGLYAIFHDMMPYAQHVDMEWSDALEVIVSRLHEHEVSLKNYLAAHSATLDDATIDLLKQAMGHCSVYKFHDMDEGLGRNAKIGAEEALHDVERAIAHLRSQVRAPAQAA